jgi:cytochrome c5
MQVVTIFSQGYFFRLCCVVALLALATGQVFAQAPGTAPRLPPGDGMEFVAEACTQCHGLKTIMTLREGPASWKVFVDDMILRGAQLEPREADAVIQYLSKNFGPSAGPMQSGKGDSQPLPDGPGQNLVQSHCTLCHDLSRVTATKRNKEEWDFTVKAMMAKVGGMATPKDMDTMSSYLADQFGKSR